MSLMNDDKKLGMPIAVLAMPYPNGTKLYKSDLKTYDELVDFIKKYKLPSASSVQSALRGLIDKNIVSVNEGSYRISDFFLTEWCATYL